MKLKRLVPLLALLVASQGHADKTVQVIGDAARPGPVAVTSTSRLGDVFRTAQVNAEGYWLGASWQQQSLVPAQKRLKAGILFDLSLLQQKALLDQQQPLAELAKRLYTRIRALPVTGRRNHLLDPVAVEVTAAENSLVQAGDRFIFPARPNSVRVVGAVSTDCRLAYVPMQHARDYVKACSPLAEADDDYIYLIQPDGQVTRLGTALWNLEEGQLVAPGATVLVPVEVAGPTSAFPQLNAEMSEFIATQPLSEVAQ
ncbi:capsule biosynthesis GfcC family protein [Pseudomonas sp. R3.Fl]|uniref:capsule biosynthesis GfcC family protein n=1 Tax=Pseudomonas sp. R3.Fl TaxID=2928708 RepID=UPI00201D3528|nr:capsule biosynthesis GfcC family protein [Pseudomonas sp. R3.Fl]MCL6688678.1 capsule biosynthesis GfcC family protein [Pseudomonas sp. R3.Fl]